MPSKRFLARRFSFLAWVLDLPASIAFCTGALFLELLEAVRHPSSSPRAGALPLPGALADGSLPGRSKPHISHSRRAELFKKVHRGHSQSREAVWLTVCRDASGLRATLVAAADGREGAGGL